MKKENRIILRNGKKFTIEQYNIRTCLITKNTFYSCFDLSPIESIEGKSIIKTILILENGLKCSIEDYNHYNSYKYCETCKNDNSCNKSRHERFHIFLWELSPIRTIIIEGEENHEK